MCSFCDAQPKMSEDETGSGQGAGELHPWVSVLQPSGGSHGFPGLSRHTGKEGCRAGPHQQACFPLQLASVLPQAGKQRGTMPC